MSWKVPAAWRTPVGVDLWPLIRDIRQKGEAEVSRVLSGIYDEVASSLDTSKDRNRRAVEVHGSEHVARLHLADEIVRQRYRDQASSPHRNEWDFDVRVVLRELEGRVYLLPQCDIRMAHVLDFLASDPRLEDFRYWDNTDPPEDVSDTEWQMRREVWRELDDHWDDSLVLTVCDVHGFHLVSPLRVLLQNHGGPKGRLEDQHG